MTSFERFRFRIDAEIQMSTQSGICRESRDLIPTPSKEIASHISMCVEISTRYPKVFAPVLVLDGPTHPLNIWRMDALVKEPLIGLFEKCASSCSLMGASFSLYQTTNLENKKKAYIQ